MALRNYFDNEFGKSRGLINNKAMDGGNMGYYTPTPTANQMAQPRDFKQNYDWQERGIYQTGAPGVHQYVASNSQVAWDKINDIARSSGDSGAFGAGIGVGAGVGTGIGSGAGGIIVPRQDPGDAPQAGDTGLGGPADGTPAYLDRTAQMAYAQADAQTSVDNANKMAKARAAAQGLDYNPNAFDYAAQQSMVSSQANNAGVKTDIANVGFKNDFEKLKIQEGYADRRMLAQLKEQEKQAQMQTDIARQQNFMEQRKYNDQRKDLRAKGRAAKQLLDELEKRNATNTATGTPTTPTTPTGSSNGIISKDMSSNGPKKPTGVSYYPYHPKVNVGEKNSGGAATTVNNINNKRHRKGSINGESTSDYMLNHYGDYDAVGNTALY